MSEKKKRTMISMRFPEETLDMLDEVKTLKGTQYEKKSRTWLVLYAVNNMYKGLVAKNGGKDA